MSQWPLIFNLNNLVFHWLTTPMSYTQYTDSHPILQMEAKCWFTTILPRRFQYFLANQKQATKGNQEHASSLGKDKPYLIYWHHNSSHSFGPLWDHNHIISLSQRAYLTYIEPYSEWYTHSQKKLYDQKREANNEQFKAGMVNGETVRAFNVFPLFLVLTVFYYCCRRCLRAFVFPKVAFQTYTPSRKSAQKRRQAPE